MLDCQRHLFEIEDHKTYLNCAYMSPQLKAVTVAGIKALQRKAKPYEVSTEDFFVPMTRVKAVFAQLIDCPEQDRIALIPAASYGLSIVAKNIPLEQGDEIIVSKDQFPSNYYPWDRLASEKGGKVITVGVEEGQNKGQRWNEAILESINSKTRLVAISHVHWAEGVRFDLKAIRQRTREVGALLVVDGTQSVGALPFSVTEIQPDALICAGYKFLMGPYGSGVAYFGPAFDNGLPIEENWINRKDSHDFKNLVNYQSEYQPLAGRYSVGEQSNFIVNAMLEVAFEQLNDWQPAQVQAYCKKLNAKFLPDLINRGINILPEDQRAENLLGLRLPAGSNVEKLQQKLVKAEIALSFRGEAIRVSPHVYNNENDWGRLAQVLMDFLVV